MEIELEQEQPETVRVDSLAKGDAFIYDGAFFMRIGEMVNVPPAYVLTVNLKTGETRSTRGDVCVIPVLLRGTKAVKLRAVRGDEEFTGLEGGTH